VTADLAREAIRLLQDAIDKPPPELKGEVDEAERAIVAVRDSLIERLRAGEQVRQALDRVNVALSLVVGVEYPQGGLARPMLEQARDELQATLQAGLRT
jgi:hypothetical protein